MAQKSHCPSPREGFGLLLVSWSLFALGSFILLGRGGGGAVSLMTLELGGILMPAVAWSIMTGFPLLPRSDVRGRGLAQAALLSVGGPAAALGLAGLLTALFPAREEERLLGEFVMAYAPWARYALFALLPAVCEEILFRGAFLGCLAEWEETPACVLSAAAFGLFHGSLLRFLPVAVLGYALALVVRRTGSIWPAVAIHALHNGLVLALTPLETVDVPPALYGAALAMGVFLFAAAWVTWRKAGSPGKGGNGVSEYRSNGVSEKG
jgi:sodium transport system permease protein